MRYTQPAHQAPAVDFERALIDATERFNRSIWMLGADNRRGTHRHAFEVDFMHLVDDLQRGPMTSRDKRLEQLNSLITAVINLGKLNKSKSFGKVAA